MTYTLIFHEQEAANSSDSPAPSPAFNERTV